MKKDLKNMTINDAEYIFSCHIDGGYYKHPYFYGYHENGIGNITQTFKCHIREADRKKVNELFNVDWNSVPNCKIINSYTFEDNIYLKKHSYKIRKILKKRFKLTNKETKGDLKKLCNSYGLNITVNKIDKFK